MSIELENDALYLACEPERGGKIFSLYYRPMQAQWLYQGDGSPLISESFTAADAYGFDEMFPSILPENCPDHGMLWSASWRVEDWTRERVALSYSPPSGQWIFKRRARLEASSLYLEYELKNLGNNDVPALYTPHPLLSFFPESRISYPPGLGPLRQALHGGVMARYGELIDPSFLPLDSPGDLPAENCYKCYCSSPPGRASLSLQDRRGRLCFEYDPRQLPYLGIWINTGGWGGQKNLAFEPASAPMDSPSSAEAFGVSALLKGGDSWRWWFRFTMDEGRGA